MKGILGRKLGMTQVFSNEGELIPVTVIEATPNVVTQVKTEETDGYSAIQIGFDEKREKLATNPEKGHVAKANTTPKRVYREFRVTAEEVQTFAQGSEIAVSIFEAGDVVDVTGTSKGKGFQGVVKRHGNSRGPETHGSRHHRVPGSMGAMAPQVFKTKKLPGQMGVQTVTIQNLEIVAVDAENNLLLVKGNVPGPKRGLVTVNGSVKKEKVEAKELVNYNAPAVSETEEAAE